MRELRPYIHPLRDDTGYLIPNSKIRALGFGVLLEIHVARVESFRTLGFGIAAMHTMLETVPRRGKLRTLRSWAS